MAVLTRLVFFHARRESFTVRFWRPAELGLGRRPAGGHQFGIPFFPGVRQFFDDFGMLGGHVGFFADVLRQVVELAVARPLCCAGGALGRDAKRPW